MTTLALLFVGCWIADLGEPVTDTDPADAVCETAVALGVPEQHDVWQDNAWVEMGETIQILRGPSGGWYLWMALRTEGMGEMVHIELEGVHVGSGEMVCGAWFDALNEPEGCAAERDDFGCWFYSVESLVDEERPGCDSAAELLDGEEIAFTLRVVDDAGQIAWDERTATAVADPEDYWECP